MVQILPLRNDSIMDQFLGGLQRGAERGHEYSKMAYEAGLKRKQLESDRVKKLASLEDIKKSPYWKNASDLEKFAIEREVLGDITGQSAKSLINLQRERNLGEEFQKYLGETGQSPQSSFASQTQEEPQDFESSLSSPISTQPTPSKKPSKEGLDWMDNLSDKKLAVYAASPNKQISEHAKTLMNLKAEKGKQKLKGQERSYKRNEKYLQKVDETARSLPKMRLALGQMRSAIDNKDFSSIRNIAADFLGKDFLKTSSAQVINSAMKEFLISALGDITGRPNMFIEQQLNKAAINPQYTDEANEAILDGLELLYNLSDQEVRIKDNLESYYVDTEGEIPRDFQKIIRSSLDEISKPLFDAYETKLKSLLSPKKKGTRKSLKEIFGDE